MMHTPGPWKVLGGEPIANTVIVQDRGDFDPKYVAQTNTAHHSAGECVANARLIAAAPDLYAALLGLMNEPQDITRPSYVAALEAISKVEGTR